MAICDWNELPKTNYEDKGNQENKIKFLKFEDNKRYRVRLISKPNHYLQHFQPIMAISPGCSEDGTVIDPLMQMGFKPTDRYSIWVFDREDGNALKIMDFGISIYKEIVEWKVAFNEEPGGMNGCDFQIKTEGIKRSRKYRLMALDKVPFTDEELTLIRGGDLKKKLDDLRKPMTPEEIKRKYEKAKADGKLRVDDDETKSPASMSSTPTSQVSAPAPAPRVVAPAPQAATPAPVAAPKPVGEDPLNW